MRVRKIDREASAFRALGHPVRLGIVARLAEEPETCACDFTDDFGVSQPTISEHLRTLREAGLVVTGRRGTQVCYSLAPGAFAELARRLEQLEAVAV